MEPYWIDVLNESSLFGKPITFLHALRDFEHAKNVVMLRGPKGATEDAHIVIQEPVYHPIVAIDELKTKLCIDLMRCYR
jgi:hypothetical protein